MAQLETFRELTLRVSRRKVLPSGSVLSDEPTTLLSRTRSDAFWCVKVRTV